MDIQSLYDRGINRFNSGDYTGAIEDFNQIIQINPDTSHELNSIITTILLEETKFFFEQNDYSGAIKNLNQAINLNPDDAELYCYRSFFHEKQNNYRLTVEDLNKAINLNPHISFFYFSLANTFVHQNDYVRAGENLNQAINLEPNNSFFYCFRGANLHLQGDYYGAIENLNKAINLDPNNSEFYSYRGSIRYLVEDVTEAIKDTEQAININNRTADNYLQLGLYLVRIKDFQKAIDNYTKALEINPYLTLALLCRSRAYLYFGDFKKALEDCELMLRLHQNTNHSESEPNSFSAFLSSKLMKLVRYPYEVFEVRAYTRYSLKDWNGAIEDFTYIIRNPELDQSHKIYYYYYYRAIAYWKQGDNQKAIIDCREAINLNQEFADAYKVRGLMLCKQGEPQKGIGIWDLQKAAKLYFKQGDIKSSESILETIRNLDTPEETLCINATIIDLQKRVQALEFEQLQRQLILDPVICQNRSDLYKLQQQLANIQPSIEIQSAQIGNLQEEVTDIRLIQQHQSAKLDDLQQQFKDFQYHIAEFINANIRDIEALQVHMAELELEIRNVSNIEFAAKQIIEINEYLERINPQYQYKLLFNRYESHQILKEALNQTKKELIMVCPWLSQRVIQPLIKDFQKILEIGYIYIGYGFKGDIIGYGFKEDIDSLKKITHSQLLKAAKDKGDSWKYDAIEDLLKLDKLKLKLVSTHAKFLICDDKFAMFGSHNFLTSGPNKNERELGLFTTDQRIINTLIADFENADNVEEEN